MDRESAGLKTFSHGVGQNWYHLVLTPKYRAKVFQFPKTRRLAEEAFEWICKRHKIEIFTMEVMPDHVHMFVSCPPTFSVRKMIRIIKGGSSFYIRKGEPSLKKFNHLWNKGIMYRSIGNVSAEVVRRYIDESNVWETAVKQ